MRRVRTVVAMGICLGMGVLLAAGILRTLPVWSAPVPAAPGTFPAAPAQGTSAFAVISGQITRDDGAPAAGVQVVARSTHYVSTAPAGEAVTDAAGRYKITVDTGLSPRLFQSESSAPPDTEFTVTVEGQEPLFLVPPSRTVVLPPDLIRSGLDFRLTTGPQVTLRVRDSQTGHPVPGVVAQYRTSQPYSNDTVTAGETTAQGQAVFRVPGLNAWLSLVLPGGNTPAVRVASGFLSREISLTQVQDVAWEVETEPTTPPTTPTVWQGVVLSADGKPALGAKVSVLRSGEEFSGVTEGSGHFAISVPPENAQQYNDRFRGFAILAEKGDQTTVFVPAADAAWAETTVQLERQPLGHYIGTVVAANGSPEAGVPVSCRGGLEIAPNSGAGISRGTVTDASGHFDLAGLPAGHYQVNFGGGAFGPVTLPPSDPGYPYSNTFLPLGNSERHDLGRVTVLPADEVVAGQIVDAGGKPVSEGITVIVHGAHTNQMASLDSQGRFRVYHVVREPLTLDLYQVHTNGGTSLGQNSPDLFRKVPVEAGRQDVRVMLPPGIPVPPPLPALPPSASSSIFAPLAGPPRLAVTSATQKAAGLLLTFSTEPHASGEIPAADPDPALVQVTLSVFNGPSSASASEGRVWAGSLTQMQGMTLTERGSIGTLADPAGHTLWHGPLFVPLPLVYSVVTDSARPNFLSVQDRQGKTLWSGRISDAPSATTFVDGDLAVIGPLGRIVWEGTASSQNVEYRTLNYGKLVSSTWFDVRKFSRVIQFGIAPHRVTFQPEDGPAFSATVPMLTLTEKNNAKKSLAEMEDMRYLSLFGGFLFAPGLICPYTLGDYSGGLATSI